MSVHIIKMKQVLLNKRAECNYQEAINFIGQATNTMVSTFCVPNVYSVFVFWHAFLRHSPRAPPYPLSQLCKKSFIIKHMVVTGLQAVVTNHKESNSCNVLFFFFYFKIERKGECGFVFGGNSIQSFFFSKILPFLFHFNTCPCLLHRNVKRECNALHESEIKMMTIITLQENETHYNNTDFRYVLFESIHSLSKSLHSSNGFLTCRSFEHIM